MKSLLPFRATETTNSYLLYNTDYPRCITSFLIFQEQMNDDYL